MKKIVLLLFILNLFQNLSFGQKKSPQQLIDSLLLELPKCKEDTNKAKVLYSLADNYEYTSKYENGIHYAHSGLLLAQKANNIKLEGMCYNIIGLLYTDKGDNDKALENFFAAQKIMKETLNRKGIAVSNNNIGMIYYNKGNYDKALEFFLTALKLVEQIGNKSSIADAFNTIGAVYEKKNNYDKALENYFSSLKMAEKIGDKRLVSIAHNNIGMIFLGKSNYEKALENFKVALKINKEIGGKAELAGTYINIGNTYFYMKNYNKALENYSLSLIIAEEIDYKAAISKCHDNIGQIYLKQNKIKEAKQETLLALSISKETGEKFEIAQSFRHLAKCDSASGNWKSAYEYHKLFKNFSDSIFNAESENKTAEMNAKYESEKKEAAIKLLEKDKEKQAAVSAEESKRQKTILFSVLGGLALVLVFSVFMFNRWRVTQKQKNIIAEQKDVVENQKEIVEKQKHLVEEKNQEITDSITYALRIQTAILPPPKIVKQYLENSFILYKPKDIVAGDFYWMETTLSNSPEGGEIILFAACDCTGHGVPGAMVSVVCHNALNRAVREFGLTQPATILDKTAEIVIENFSKSEEDIKDGMDISLCSINFSKVSNFGKVELQWAGANNPLWLLQNGELIETKADKQPIGMNEDSKPFTNHTFELNNGDSIYLFTDGFADQFGGETGQKKLTRKRFKDLILSVQTKSLQEQGIALDKFITEYRKNIEQIDDILVMGVRI